MSTTIDRIEIPTTPLANRALEVATTFYSAPLLHHCLRSYIWGASWADMRDVPFDSELLYVAALLHDLGLTRAFDSHHIAFEEAGGDVAWVFLTGAGWPVERREQVREVIVLHMRDDVAAEANPEAHLLQVAVTLDVSGGRAGAFSESLKHETLTRYPRLDFSKEFTALCAAQAARKPTSAAAAVIRGGIAERAANNPLDR